MHHADSRKSYESEPEEREAELSSSESGSEGVRGLVPFALCAALFSASHHYHYHNHGAHVC